MRPKFILTLILVLVGFGAVWYSKRPSTNNDSLPSPPDRNVASSPQLKSSSTVITSTPAKTVGSNITPEKRAEAIETEVTRLRELAMKDDAESLAGILADLTHPEKEVREVAIESAKEFGSSNAIPALKYAAQNNEDVQEKIALLEAAQFLSLPPLTFENTPDTRTPEQIQAAEQRRAERNSRKEAEQAGRQTIHARSTQPGTSPGSWKMTNSLPAP